MAKFTRKQNGFIYLFHWIDGKSFFRVSTKMKIDEKDWCHRTTRPKSMETKYKDKSISQEINRYEAALHHALALQPELTANTLHTFKRVFQRCLNPTETPVKEVNRLLPYFKQYVVAVTAKKQSNSSHYNTCCNHLTRFFGKRNPKYEDINMRFYKEFTAYLTNENLSINTISNQFKLLKSVMQSAFVEGLHTNEQFRNFKKVTESTDSIYLSEKELTAMFNLKLTGHLAKARDYFIIGAFTGLRYEDWHKVTSDTLTNGVMKIRSNKTDEICAIPIHPFVRATLERNEGTMPPKPTNQRMNEYIKIVALKAGIDEVIETRITRGGIRETEKKEKHELVSTHTARRSLATNLVLRGVSPYVIMKITGHKHLENFDKYVRLRELEATMQLKNLDFFN